MQYNYKKLQEDYTVLQHLVDQLKKVENLHGEDKRIMPDSYFEEAGDDSKKEVNPLFKRIYLCSNRTKNRAKMC